MIFNYINVRNRGIDNNDISVARGADKIQHG